MEQCMHDLAVWLPKKKITFDHFRTVIYVSIVCNVQFEASLLVHLIILGIKKGPFSA